MKRVSKRNKDYWINLGFSEQDAIREARSKMPGTIEYFIYYKKMPPLEAEVALKEWHDKRINTLENMVVKYGPIEGSVRWEKYKEKQAYSNTLDYMIKKYGLEKGTEKYYRANKLRAVTKENLINKHGGEVGEKMFSDYVEKQRTAGISEEYFINKLGEKEGKEFFLNLNKRKANTYSSFLDRCEGDVEKATEEYNKYCIKRSESISFSKCSQSLFNELGKQLDGLGIFDYYFHSKNQEWGINIIGKRFVYLDFFVRSKGKAIEFNGDYYHANPIKYSENSEINIKGTKRLVKEIWEEDKKRIDDILTVPYIKEVLVIWEYEWTHNKEETIKKCLEFILK